MKSFFCLFRLLLHTLGAFFYGTVVYPFIDDSKKNLYVQKWSKKLLDICGVTRESRQSPNCSRPEP